MEDQTNSSSTDGINESPLNNSTTENLSDENIETDYNNNEENITNLGSVETQQINNEAQSINIQIGSDHYTQLFEDNPDNPFFKCKIDSLNYDTDDEQNDEYLRVLIIWNYEFNYDYFHLKENKIFITKNQSFFSMLNEIGSYRNSGNSNTTGIIEKISNPTYFKVNDNVHLYLIVYYDNAKCNIDFYGIFNQELDEDKVLKNIIDEKVYGNNGKIANSVYITSTGGEGFLLIHNCLTIE